MQLHGGQFLLRELSRRFSCALLGCTRKPASGKTVIRLLNCNASRRDQFCRPLVGLDWAFGGRLVGVSVYDRVNGTCHSELSGVESALDFEIV